MRPVRHDLRRCLSFVPGTEGTSFRQRGTRGMQVARTKRAPLGDNHPTASDGIFAKDGQVEGYFRGDGFIEALRSEAEVLVQVASGKPGRVRKSPQVRVALHSAVENQAA